MALLLVSTSMAPIPAVIAADLPSGRAPPVYIPPVTPPVFTWTGVYVGGQVGYAFGSDQVRASAAGTHVGLASTSANGVIGGAHIGYNYATRGPAVPR